MLLGQIVKLHELLQKSIYNSNRKLKKNFQAIHLLQKTLK